MFTDAYWIVHFIVNIWDETFLLCSNLYVVILQMSQSHGSSSRSGCWSLLRREWQIIWLFIMNCHVSQGNYINYLTESGDFLLCCTTSITFHSTQTLFILGAIIRNFTSCFLSFFVVSEKIIKQQMTKRYKAVAETGNQRIFFIEKINNSCSISFVLFFVAFAFSSVSDEFVV